METEEITRSLSKRQKIALWCAFVWVLSILFGAIDRGLYSIVAVCVVLLPVILCSLKNIIAAKYAWKVFAVSLILPFIMVGILDSSKDNSSTKQEIKQEEQPKEAVKSKDADKPKNEQTEKVEDKGQEPQLSPKEKEVAEAGSKQGTLLGMGIASNEELSNMLDMADYIESMKDEVDKLNEDMAGSEYDKRYGAPTNAEEQKLKKIYMENFIKAMNNTMDDMDVLEKLGGKH